ncbi:unnamed protein product [Sphenostylis stenocarpa]|uniref:Uncharacterized protein n=1 Tax=Sphenostylis stenocarpa TaxID=92480 RepID=A0AA86VMB9_9FABA|nr:unnamed protein product [Sphenostylis stenocarpa]
MSDTEPETPNTGSTAKKSKRRRRKDYMVDEEGQVESRQKLAKRILLSLTRPSYVMGLGPKPLRVEHRTRLRYLLRRLVNQHHWVAASGVLSAYLKGTLNDTSPLRNRLRFWVLMELLKYMKNNSINSTKIKNLYDIWSKKIGSMKTWPLQLVLKPLKFFCRILLFNVEAAFLKLSRDVLGLRKRLIILLMEQSRYAVHFEFMLFCLMQGNAGDAYQLALCLEQERVDIDPVSKMMMGLTFYELWYSSIPKEFQWRNSDQVDMRKNSQMEETSFMNETEQSEWYHSVESHMADSQCQRDSDASIMNDKHISKDVVFSEDMEVGTIKREKPHQNFQPEGFYLNSEEQKGFEDPFSISGGLTEDILHGLVQMGSHIGISDTRGLYQINHFTRQRAYSFSSYDVAERGIVAATVDSSRTACSLFWMHMRLLLIGGQVDETLNMLEKQCRNTASVLPLRVRAALLERFDRNNSVMLLSCFENILKKDPTCSDALAKLIKMHQNGYYSLESLLEMIALHLDVTDAEHNLWKVFSSCFLRLSTYEEDCMSSCPIQAEDGHKQLCSFSKIPKIFTDGISGKSWKLRCRWWLTRHFSNSKLELEIESGDLQLLTYKAACASYMYGRDFSYVEKAYSHLEKENDEELLLFLNEHSRANSLGIYKKI